MSRGKMCERLREQRKARQQVKYALIRHRRTHKGRTGHRFVRNTAYAKKHRICAVCGQGY